MTKKYSHLVPSQRYQLEALLATGISKVEIAKIIGVNKSTIYRELKRNSTHAAKPPDKYKAANAQNFAERRAFVKMPSVSCDASIVRRIIFLLKAGWSPQQIACTCKKRNIPMLSTEAIYLWVYDQKKKGNDYTSKLRRHHRKRRKRRLTNQTRVIIKNKKSIHDRPPVVAEQSRIGDFEADLVKCQNGYIVNITERKTLFNIMEKVITKDAQSVEQAIVKALLPYKEIIKTITSDNGTEFANHLNIAETLEVDWYFADAYKSQQRGANENQNGLIRQYLKRDNDLANVSEQKLKKIQNQLNARPRKKLGYLSPTKYLLLNHNVALAA
jgi:transposase, IS30 family